MPLLTVGDLLCLERAIANFKRSDIPETSRFAHYGLLEALLVQVVGELKVSHLRTFTQLAEVISPLQVVSEGVSREIAAYQTLFATLGYRVPISDDSDGWERVATIEGMVTIEHQGPCVKTPRTGDVRYFNGPPSACVGRRMKVIYFVKKE